MNIRKRNRGAIDYGRRFLALLLVLAMAAGDLPMAAVRAAVPLDTVIKIDEDILTGRLKALGKDYSYDYPSKTIEARYQEESPAYADVVLTAAKGAVSVEVDGNVMGSLSGKLIYQWQQLGTDGNYANMEEGKFPHAVGKYQLLASIEAVEETCKEASAVAAVLEVKKALLELGGCKTAFEAGTTVAEIRKANEDLALRLGGVNVDKADYVSAVKIQVKELYSDGFLEDTDALQQNRDYQIIFRVTLKEDVKDRYEVGENSFPVRLSAPVPTKVVIAYTTEDKVIAKPYDGQPIDYETLVKPEYTAKVVKLVNDENGDPKEVELENAALVGRWCDGNKKEYENDKYVPSDAGTYFYKLSYTDSNGSYADSEDFIRVEIKTASIVIEPFLTDSEIYEDTYVGTVLEQVSYNVYRVVNGVKNAVPEAIDESYWGLAYDADNNGVDSNNHQNGNLGEDGDYTLQYYEPVFAIQQSVKDDEGEIIDWVERTNYYDRLEKNYTKDMIVTDEDGVSETVEKKFTYEYRLVFSGKKAVYDRNGTPQRLQDVNNNQQNFTVDTSNAAITANAKSLTLLTAREVEINVDEIVANFDGKGRKYEDPIVWVYNGNPLYENKGMYKKAVACDKSSGDSLAKGSLTYCWERAYTFNAEPKKDDTGNVIVDKEGNPEIEYVPEWDVYRDVESDNLQDVEVKSAPDKVGVYRLKITYSDSERAHRSETSYVYYTIAPQDAVMVLHGAPAIYADGVNTVRDLLLGIQNSDPDKVETYIDMEMYYATVAEDDEGKAVVRKAEAPFETIYTSYLFESIVRRTTYLIVEKAGKKAGTWEKCGLDDVLDKDQKYRLNVGRAYTDNYLPNYNFGRKLDRHNLVLEEDYYGNEGVPVNLKKTEGVEVEISVDTTELNTEKVYDGEAFDLTAVKNIVKISRKDDGTDVTAEVASRLKYSFIYHQEDEDIVYSVEEAIHGGRYELEISLDTDDTYKAASMRVGKDFVIRQKELKVIPTLRAEIPAGLYPGSAMGKIVSGHTLEGAVKGDTSILTVTSWKVCEKTSDRPYNNYLRSSGTYYVKADIYDFNIRRDQFDNRVPYSRDYTAICEPAEFTPVRVAAGIDRYEDNYRWLTRLRDVVSENAAKDGTKAVTYSHAIRPLEGVPYIYTREGFVLDGKSVEGNYFLFRLYAPKEFADNVAFTFDEAGFVYRNSIERSGGYIYAEGFDAKEKLPYIVAAFDANPRGVHSFEIFWEKDYPEYYTVSLEQAILESDLSKAVAPKTLAFNGVASKMAVGETQQLDVKMTKSQMSDTIFLGYKSDNENVLLVNESGFVTALAASKTAVTVEVYPCRLIDGEKVPIEGAKSAKTKITVTAVAAPKISKVAAADVTAEVSYVKPANGYRREFYVMDGKRKAEEFEAAIAAVKNGDFSAFVYTSFMEPAADRKGVVRATVERLAPAGEYTVYVRNVSGMRELEDGSQIYASYAGAVKTFKTLHSQANELELYFDKDLAGQTVFYDELIYNCYVARLADKSATLSAKGRFLERYSQSYSDSTDYIWRSLPLSKELLKCYTTPKLDYYVSEGRYDSESRAIRNWGVGNYVEWDGYYYKKTASIASVDKKGKMSFKGKGYVFAVAIDRRAGIGDVTLLYIDASPDKMTAKPVKMKPGESIYLSDYLDYQEKKVRIVNYPVWHPYDVWYQEDYNASMFGFYYRSLDTEQTSNEDYKIERTSQGDIKVTALRAGGKLEFDITDTVVAANGGEAAAVKLTTSAIEPVKNLKANPVFDDRFTVNFSYPLGEYDFCFELKDARGNIICNELIEDMVCDRYDARTRKYLYSKTFQENITRLSGYTVTVTALCNDVPSKATTLKVKTTNIPASYYTLQPEQINAGISVYVSCVNSYSGRDDRSFELAENPVLKSGNGYTLNAPLADGNMTNFVAKLRMTDSLVWKSSDTKVAMVKPNTGSFSATLKALKQGRTIIEVSSKVSKQVIARYVLYVGAVGVADDFFGENENYDFGDRIVTTPNDRDMLKVIVDTPVTVTMNKGEAQWFVFTSPARGSYNINTHGTEAYYFEGRKAAMDKEPVSVTASGYAKALEKNAKIYLCVVNDDSDRKTVCVDITGTVYEEAFVGKNQIKGGKTVFFTAPEDNYYTITRAEEEGENEELLGQYALRKGEELEFHVGGSAKKEYTVTVSKREIAARLSAGGNGIVVTLGENEEKWYAYTTKEWNRYTFFSTDAKEGALNVEYYTSLYDLEGEPVVTGSPNIQMEKEIDKNATVYLKLTATLNTPSTPATATSPEIPGTPVTAVLRVKKRLLQELPLAVGGEGTEISFGKYEEKWYQFTAQESNRYVFSIDGATENLEIDYYTDFRDRRPADSVPCKKDKTAALSEKGIEEGTTVYVSVSRGKNTWAQDTAAATLKVEKVMADLQRLDMEKDEILSLTGSEKKWYQFTAPEEGRYVFSLSGVSKSMDMCCYAELADEKFARYSSGTSDFALGDLYTEKGNTIYIVVQANGAEEDSTTAKLSVKMFTVANKLTLGNDPDHPVDITTAKSGDHVWYVFTASEDANYRFTITGTEVRANRNLYVYDTLAQEDKTTADVSVSSLFTARSCEKHLSTGETVYLDLVAEADNCRTSLSVEKVE